MYIYSAWGGHAARCVAGRHSTPTCAVSSFTEFYRGTPLIRNTHPVGSYSSPMPRDLWLSGARRSIPAFVVSNFTEFSNVTYVNPVYTCALRRSTLDFCRGGQRSRSKGEIYCSYTSILGDL